jgi:hypothetical protein
VNSLFQKLLCLYFGNLFLQTLVNRVTLFQWDCLTSCMTFFQIHLLDSLFFFFGRTSCIEVVRPLKKIYERNIENKD